MLTTASRVLKKDSTCINALLTRGDIFASLGKIDSAKFSYLKAHLFYPSNVYVLYQLGLLYEGLRVNDSAFYYFKTALQNKVRDSALVDYSNTLKKLDNKDAQYDIPTIELIFRYGIVSYYLRDMQLAVKNFDLCISNNYMLNQSYLYKGAISFEMGNSIQACENFRKALQYGNENAQDYISKYCR